MRRALLALFSACALSAAASAAGAAEPIRYTVTPELSPEGVAALKVEMRFTGDADGRTDVMLPSDWSGATQLWRAVHDVEAQGAEVQRRQAELSLRHRPRAEVSVSYRVRQDFEGRPSARGGPPFRAITQPDWFTVLGWSLFGEIRGRRYDPVAFAWGQTPEGWAVASDLDHTAAKPRIMSDLLDSVMVGGRGMNLVETEAAGGRLRIAIHGQWSFSEKGFSDLLSRVAETSADFWGDRGENFFVAVTPLTGPRDSTVQYGVGLGDAFSLWATPDVKDDMLKHIVAHEHQHTWFPGRVGGVREGDDELLDYWFSEGFTDFYTLRLLLRSGLWSLEEFVADYNRILRNYAASPARDAPNSQIKAAFFQERAFADLPYQRGLLLAALWDDRLRRQTGGQADLDDVVLKMAERAQGPFHGSGPQLLKSTFEQLGGGDLDRDYDRFVDGGARVLLPQDLFGSCATVDTHEVPVFDRGFDTAATSARDGVVAGVDPAGPAYAAGLRNGMRIVGREAGEPGDSRIELVYRVQASDGEKLIRYRPTGRQTMKLQEIALAENLTPEQRADCAKRMAGD